MSLSRHYQEIIDALGRSLSLVSAPDPSHDELARGGGAPSRASQSPGDPDDVPLLGLVHGSRRGPGYLRRWIAGETLGARLERMGADDVAGVLRVMREIGSALSYLHDSGAVHGAMSPRTVVWMTPMGRLWLIGLAVGDAARPRSRAASRPTSASCRCRASGPTAQWLPTAASDQWQLAATCFAVLTGETPPSDEVPPIQLLRPDCPRAVAAVIDRALSADPAERLPVRRGDAARDRSRSSAAGRWSMLAGDEPGRRTPNESPKARLRWALADDYEVLAALGAGSFGSVWRVRDLITRPRGRAQAAAPARRARRAQRGAISPRGEARRAARASGDRADLRLGQPRRRAWYTMELAEGGSVADLVARVRPARAHRDRAADRLQCSAASRRRTRSASSTAISSRRTCSSTDIGGGASRTSASRTSTGEERAGASRHAGVRPPEQLLGETQDAAADCFSLAAIVAFALTGTPPFGERDSAHDSRARAARRRRPVGRTRRRSPSGCGAGLSPDAGRSVRGRDRDAGGVARGGADRLRARAPACRGGGGGSRG